MMMSRQQHRVNWTLAVHSLSLVTVVFAEKTPGSRAEVGRVSPEISMSGHPMDAISAAVKGRAPEKDSSEGQVSPKHKQVVNTDP